MAPESCDIYVSVTSCSIIDKSYLCYHYCEVNIGAETRFRWPWVVFVSLSPGNTKMPDHDFRDSNFVPLPTSGMLPNSYCTFQHSWEIFDRLCDADKESYDKLKKAILYWLNPDTDEYQLPTCYQLSQRRLCEVLESID